MTLIAQLSTQEGKKFSAAMHVIYKDSTGNWQGITISQELREQICDRLSESYGGRERTKLAVYRKLISTPTPQHWSLERFLLVKYSDKPAKFSYCAGQDQQWENADARKFFTK